MKSKSKPKAKKEVYVFKGEPVTANELLKLRDRLGAQMKLARGMMNVAMYRLAMDCDYLSLLLDREKGQQRFNMWVQVKASGKTKKPKTPHAEGDGQ